VISDASPNNPTADDDNIRSLHSFRSDQHSSLEEGIRG
jgi:hypothetical protein